MKIDGYSSYNTYANLSSGKRINSASDDPAGAAIVEKLQSQTNGYDVATRNAEDMYGLLETGDSALGSIEDSIKRMRELSVQASNGTLSDSDKHTIQIEISQIQEGIKDTINYTEFNGQKLLDGSFQNKNTAMNPDGNGMKINILQTDLDKVLNLDVTGDFDLEDIDHAIESVSTAKGSIGATQNRINHGIRMNDRTYQDLVSSQSRIQDMDISEEITNMKRDYVLQQYNFFAQKNSMYAMTSQVNFLLWYAKPYPTIGYGFKTFFNNTEN